MTDPLAFRSYRPADADAVWRLHEWALEDAGTDPTDLPGVDDLETVEETYFGAGGSFIVGGVPEEVAAEAVPRTADGAVVAMGGFLPNETGHDDERTVEGAAELHRMRVAPPHQGRGFGRQLLAELEERAEDGGFEVVLATTARRQQAAVELYAAAGYDRVGTSTYDDYRLIHFEKRLE